MIYLRSFVLFPIRAQHSCNKSADISSIRPKQHPPSAQLYSLTAVIRQISPSQAQEGLVVSLKLSLSIMVHGTCTLSQICKLSFACDWTRVSLRHQWHRSIDPASTLSAWQPTRHACLQPQTRDSKSTASFTRFRPLLLIAASTPTK